MSESLLVKNKNKIDFIQNRVFLDFQNIKDAIDKLEKKASFMLIGIFTFISWNFKDVVKAFALNEISLYDKIWEVYLD